MNDFRVANFDGMLTNSEIIDGTFDYFSRFRYSFSNQQLGLISVPTVAAVWGREPVNLDWTQTAGFVP